MPEVRTPRELFFDISGYEYHSENPSTVTKDNQKIKPHLLNRPDMDRKNNFDYEWEKSKSSVTNINEESLMLVDQPAS